jgi:hypothetical protein
MMDVLYVFAPVIVAIIIAGTIGIVAAWRERHWK